MDESKAWHETVLAEFCRMVPLRVLGQRNKTVAEKRRYVDETVATLKRLLEAILL